MEPLSSKFITKIAASLRNEKQVLSNLPMLADVLEVSEDVKITSCKVGSKTGYECIKSILSDWSSNKVAAEANINNLQIKFRRMGLGKAAELLNKIDDSDHLLCLPSPTTPTYRRINILKPVPNFSGRKNELSKLTDWYSSDSNQVVVISAMGGQGKTELARKFIDAHESNRHCAWMNGDGRQIFLESLEKLISEIDIEFQEGQSFKELCSMFCESREIKAYEWLLIVDNVDSIFEEFEEFVREATTHGTKFIVTGRPLDFFPGECEFLGLGTLEMNDAKDLVCKYLGMGVIESDLTNLCEILGCHALAIAQAATYIRGQMQMRNSAYSIKDYIRDFTALKLDLPLKLHSNKYDKTFCKVVSLSILAVKAPPDQCEKCVDIALNILSLVRQDGISYPDFIQFFSTVTHQVDIKIGLFTHKVPCTLQADEALTALSDRVSLISHNGHWISIHRLIQAFVLDSADWNETAESILDRLTHFDKNVNVAVLWHLKSIYLNLRDPSTVSKYKELPGKIALATLQRKGSGELTAD